MRSAGSGPPHQGRGLGRVAQAEEIQGTRGVEVRIAGKEGIGDTVLLPRAQGVSQAREHGSGGRVRPV
jgi:hypothetical protein